MVLLVVVGVVVVVVVEVVVVVVQEQPTSIPTWSETTGAPHEARLRKTRPPQSPKKATTQTNTRPHMQGGNRRQRETRPLQPTNTHPHTKGDDRRPRETRRLKRPERLHTNQHPPHMKGDNRRQDHFRGQEGYHTNQHPSPHEGRLQRPRRLPHQPTPTPQTTKDNGRQDYSHGNRRSWPTSKKEFQREVSLNFLWQIAIRIRRQYTYM